MTSSDSRGTHTIFYGPVINPVSLTCHSALPQCLLSIDQYGEIEWMIDNVEKNELHESLASKGHTDVNLVTLKDGEFLMPGFIDTHTHAPQFPIMGTGNQYELLDWLIKLVFPMECNFKDKYFARKTYKSVVRRVLDFGTTTCCYYGSLHLEATKILAEIAHCYGQRAFIGKCNMNCDSPDDYIEPSTHVSVEHTKELICYIRNLDHHPGQEPLVQPILTPRFALSCTPDLLTCLGSLAASEPTLRIQTHIAENKEEVKEVIRRFQLENYAAVYDKFGLLRHNTILGHAVHLTKDEVELIKERGAGISHCPTSNFNLNSGIAPVGYYLDRGVKVGLGTDVSGGYSPSILNAIQNASIAAKALSFKEQRHGRCHPHSSSDPASQSHNHHGHGRPSRHSSSDPASQSHHHHGHEHEHDHPPSDAAGQSHHDRHHHHRHHHDHEHEHEHQFRNRPFSISTLLYLATAGGAAVCSIEKQVGSFESGKSFDALLVNVGKDSLNPGLWGLNGLATPCHDTAEVADADAAADSSADPEIGLEEKKKKELEEKERIMNDWLERFLLCGDDRNIEKVYVQGRFVGGRTFCP